MAGIGFWELVVVMIVALLVVGPRQLPILSGALARLLRQLRRFAAELEQSASAADISPTDARRSVVTRGSRKEALSRPGSSEER